MQPTTGTRGQWSRQITEHTKTITRPDGWVQAIFQVTHELDDPRHEIPGAVTTFRPSDKKWLSRLQISGWGTNEVDTLAWLASELENYEKLWPEQDRVVDVRQELLDTTTDAPWEMQDMGCRGKKPRRQRHTWRREGKRVKVYADTLRGHDDPNCPCPLCEGSTTTETE